ncbi:MAG: hypothetical protein H6737_01405 [Alphaproteobacteria bacterium]|nr:hypothetical protein [Alphaproteobacteria bacterium]
MKLRYHLLHFRPRRIEARVHELHAKGVIDVEPNLWQLWLGVLYMWHRAMFRPETIGLSERPVRDTWRARAFRFRPARSPFLFGGRRVNPLDHTGLGSTTEHTIRHLLGAHHEADDFHFDIQLVAHEPGVLDALRERLVAIVDETAPDARFLKDLCVYEGYHEDLLEGVEKWLRGEVELDHEDSDATLTGLMRWCAQQPASLRETLATGLPDFAPTRASHEEAA